MNLFVWMDENGQWRVTHRPPFDGSPTLQIALPEGVSAPVFIDWADSREINVEI